MKKQVSFVFRTKEGNTLRVDPRALEEFIQTSDKSKLPGKLIRVEAPEKLLTAIRTFIEDVTDTIKINESGEVTVVAMTGVEVALIVLAAFAAGTLVGYGAGYATAQSENEGEGDDGKNEDGEGGDKEE